MKRNNVIGGVLTGVVALGAAFATSMGASAAEPAGAAVSRYSPTQLIEGAVFLQGELGRSLIDHGALGDISSAEKTKVEELLEEKSAKQLAADSAEQLLEERPELASDLRASLEDRDPVAVSAALRNLVADAIDTSAAKAAAVAMANTDQTYVPGEVGPDCLFNVAVGGYLVIAVAGVAIGVVALASVAVVGDVVVAGENAASKRSSGGADSDGQFVAALLRSV